MNKVKEQRAEERLHYELPVWFSEDLEQIVFEGVMVDISNIAMAFSCKADEHCPYPGQNLVVQFSIPDSEPQRQSAAKNVVREGYVSRVDQLSGELCRVAIQFDEPPPFWNVPPY